MIVMRSIKPATPFKSSVFREEIEQAAKEVGETAKEDFERTVSTWKDKPKFVLTIKASRAVGGIVIEVKPDPELPYAYVDQGTKPHVIRPKKKKRLAFKSGYKAKTQPYVTLSLPGGAYGKQVIVPIVHHPGTRARRFTEVIAKTTKKELSRLASNALKRAARRCGHGTKS